MPHKSPFSQEVSAAWDELVLDKGDGLSLDQRFAGWQKLYSKCFKAGKWTVAFMDAGLCSSLGYHLAMQRKDWVMARNLANQYLSHPEVKDFPDEPHIWIAQGIEIAAGILCGDIVESAEKNLRSIDEGTFGRATKTFIYSSISNLSGVLSELVPSSKVDPQVREYAFELMRRFAGFKKRAAEVLSMETNREVKDWIDGIFKQIHARQRQKWLRSRAEKRATTAPE